MGDLPYPATCEDNSIGDQSLGWWEEILKFVATK